MENFGLENDQFKDNYQIEKVDKKKQKKETVII